MNTIARQNANSVPDIIARQIGHRAFQMMGSGVLVADGNSLTFDVKGCREWRKIKVTLTPLDTYTVDFYQFRGVYMTNQKTVEDVYADGLQQCIEYNTGLCLSL